MRDIKKCLVIGIIIFFLLVGVYPSSAIDTTKESEIPLTPGNTLYVGGSGPGNYTRIQDAINNASDGDTVFVYKGTYEGSVRIPVSIKVLGEDRQSTIIDCLASGYGVSIKANKVTFSGFTITNCDTNIYIKNKYGNIISNNIIKGWGGDGIGLWFSSDTTIHGNIFSNKRCGIDSSTSDNVRILNNQFLSCKAHGIIFGGLGDEVVGNTIHSSGWGIYAREATSCIIKWNNISQNDNGLIIRGGKLNTISENIFYNNKEGIKILFTSLNTVIWNNFIGNDRHALFTNAYTHWNRNYWDNFLGFGIKPISGQIYIELLSGGPWEPIEIIIPWVQFDWRPSKEPNDINYKYAEDAVVTAHGISGQIKLILVKGGQNYGVGYEPSDVRIFIDGNKVTPEETWVVGGEILIGQDANGKWTVGGTCSAGDYSVTVVIMDTVVYNGEVTVT